MFDRKLFVLALAAAFAALGVAAAQQPIAQMTSQEPSASSDDNPHIVPPKLHMCHAPQQSHGQSRFNPGKRSIVLLDELFVSSGSLIVLGVKVFVLLGQPVEFAAEIQLHLMEEIHRLL